MGAWNGLRYDDDAGWDRPYASLPYTVIPHCDFVAVAVVIAELGAIAWVRHRYMETPWVSATLQVVLGGTLVFVAGVTDREVRRETENDFYSRASTSQPSFFISTRSQRCRLVRREEGFQRTGFRIAAFVGPVRAGEFDRGFSCRCRESRRQVRPEHRISRLLGLNSGSAGADVQQHGVKLFAGIFRLDRELKLRTIITLLAEAEAAGRIFQSGFAVNLEPANQGAP